MKLKHGQIWIGLVCLILGLMLAVQFRTTQDIRESLPIQRAEELTSELKKVTKERDTLQNQVEALSKQLKSSAQEAVIGAEFEKLRMEAGLTSVVGPGIVMVLDDSKKAKQSGENPNLFLIHDEDLLKVVNELFAAGAEAVSINEQRLISRTEIRCAGPTISVNNTRLAPPYEIKAIGDPATLENALRMRGGVLESLNYWGIEIELKRQNSITIPSYKGQLNFEYAKPAQEGDN